MSEGPWDEFYETKVWLATKKNKRSYWRPFLRFMDHVGVETPTDLLDLSEDAAKNHLRDYRDLNASKYARARFNHSSQWKPSRFMT